MKKSILIIMFFIALALLVSCKKQDKAVEEVAQEVADAFAAGDMTTINKTIFGINELEVDERLTDIWGETNNTSQSGVLECIFQHVTLKVKKITDNIIEYEVIAPDMAAVFMNLEANAGEITEGELLRHITNCAKNAEVKTTTVSLEYILVDEVPIVDYCDEAFINAVTGGLLDAYKSLYTGMMEEYAEGAN